MVHILQSYFVILSFSVGIIMKFYISFLTNKYAECCIVDEIFFLGCLCINVMRKPFTSMSEKLKQDVLGLRNGGVIKKGTEKNRKTGLCSCLKQLGGGINGIIVTLDTNYMNIAHFEAVLFMVHYLLVSHARSQHALLFCNITPHEAMKGEKKHSMKNVFVFYYFRVGSIHTV